jgi:hypothetical protein
MHFPKHLFYILKIRVNQKSTEIKLFLLPNYSENREQGKKTCTFQKTFLSGKNSWGGKNLKTPFKSQPRSQRGFGFESRTIDVGGASIASVVYFSL